MSPLPHSPAAPSTMNADAVPDSIVCDDPAMSAAEILASPDKMSPVAEQPIEPPQNQVADPEPSDVITTDPLKHEEPNVQPSVSHSPAHITRPLTPVNPHTEDATMTLAAEAPNTLSEAVQQPASPPIHSEQVTETSVASAETHPPKPTADSQVAPIPAPHPSLPNHVVHPSNIQITMVQPNGEGDQSLSARQLGQRARRARERELQAQGLYTPKRRISSSATLPDLSGYHSSPQGQPSSMPAPAVPTPHTNGDVTMHNGEEQGDEDDDGEGELEADLPQSLDQSALPGTSPAVPPHTASHLIPPIAVLAPVTTPSRASLAQRARRERERANRLGTSPSSTASPNGPGMSPLVSTYAPIPYNPVQQVPPGSMHIAAVGQFPQQPPTLTRGQLAQRARRARERVERASKGPNGEGWTPSMNSQEGVSSAGEAVFAVAPPAPSANGTTAFATTATQHNPGYGVGLGANHVPQQLNRAQLAQRARRARERQQRLSTAGAHASNSPRVGEDGSLVHQRSPSSSSVPPVSPSARQHMDEVSRTSLSPMASSAAPGNAPAQLSIGAQFAQVFKSLTAGDNGVSRAMADVGALTSKDDMKGRNSSPVERITSPTAQRADTQDTHDTQDTQEMSVDGREECTDQLSEDSTRATTPSHGAGPASPQAADEPTKPQSPVPELKAVDTQEPAPVSPRAATPEVHMASVQLVGA